MDVSFFYGESRLVLHIPSGRGALCALGGGVNPEGVAPPPCGGHGASKYHFALSLPTYLPNNPLNAYVMYNDP